MSGFTKNHRTYIENLQEKEVKEEKEDFEDKESKKLKLKMIYNKNELIQKAKKEVALIKRKSKEKREKLEKIKKNIIKQRNIL